MINWRLLFSLKSITAGICFFSTAWAGDSTQVTPPTGNPGMPYILRSGGPTRLENTSKTMEVYPRDRIRCPNNLKAYLYMTPVQAGASYWVQGIAEIYMQPSVPTWEMTWQSDHYEISVAGWIYYKNRDDKYQYGYLYTNWIAYCGL